MVPDEIERGNAVVTAGDRKRRSGTKKMPRGRLGQHRGKTLVSGARLVRPSRPQSHMLAYKDLTRRRDTETRNRGIQMVKVGINYRFNWSGYGYGYGYGY